MPRLTWTALALLFLAAAWPSGASAQIPESAEDIARHLEFLGYEVTTGDSNLTARHDAKLDMLLQGYQGGVLIQTFLGLDAETSEALETANLLNTGAAVTRFYVDGDGDMAVEAWMPGAYDKTRFATFLDAWDADTIGQFRTHADQVRDIVN